MTSVNCKSLNACHSPACSLVKLCGCSKVCAKWVPIILTKFMKEKSVVSVKNFWSPELILLDFMSMSMKCAIKRNQFSFDDELKEATHT